MQTVAYAYFGKLLLMETFGQRLRRLRGKVSQRTLAKQINVSNGAVSKWENDGIDPNGINDLYRRALADALGVSVNFLMTGIADDEFAEERTAPVRIIENLDDVDEDTEVVIPVYNVRLQAGAGAPQPEFIETAESLTFKRSWLQKKHLNPADLRIVTVDGDSMVPLLWHGDKVAVNIKQQKVKDGKVFAMAYGTDLRVKRLYWQADGRLRIVSENKAYADEIIEGAEIERVRIIGQVMHKMGDGGL